MHIKHGIIRNLCKVSSLFSALYAMCQYYLLLYMQSVLIIHCFICNVQATSGPWAHAPLPGLGPRGTEAVIHQPATVRPQIVFRLPKNTYNGAGHLTNHDLALISHVFSGRWITVRTYTRMHFFGCKCQPRDQHNTPEVVFCSPPHNTDEDPRMIGEKQAEK